MTKAINIKAPDKIDYQEEGLVVGLEFHQQVLAPYYPHDNLKKYGSKLFCPCPAYLRDDDADFTIQRKFRAVSGEIGEIDISAQFEKNKQSTTIYEGFHDTTCLIELDEEPILPINQEALYRTLAISKNLFGLELVDEILVNRKAIIDGSNTSGFQRTAQVAYGTKNSFVMVNGKKISVYQANLEEDSAKNVGHKGATRKFRLDRLGIPLIEIATGPDIRSPEEALTTASRIGELLRTTGFVKRGQGTIRQDLNVSIKRGTRIEIKGVSELDLLPTYVKNEAIRQYRMLEILDIFKQRGITPRKIQNTKTQDLTSIFKNCKAKFVKSALKRKEKVVGVRLPGLKGLLGYELQENYRLGTELSEICKVGAGVGGILHSDELPKFGISENEVDKVHKKLRLQSQDGFMIIIGPENLSKMAISAVKNNFCLWLNSDELIPEVRAPRGDGTTGFLRPLPGKARMYPETDAKPIKLTDELLRKINQTKFEMPEERSKRYMKKLKLSKELAAQMVLHPQNHLFEEILELHKVEPKLVASTMLSTLVDIRRQGYDTDKITDSVYHEIFTIVADGTISADALPQLITGICSSEKSIPVTDLIAELDIQKMSVEEISEYIDQIVEENRSLIEERKMGAMGTLMRVAMEQLGGKAEGKLVSKLVREGIQKII